MSEATHLWVRHEVRDTERRTPVVPDDARRLVQAGLRVTVEESPQRVFGTASYQAAGCEIAPTGSWVDAPDAAVVVGLKELPEGPPALRHRHVFFGHAYKGQRGAAELLDRFVAGGGALLDIEYLVDDNGRRLAAFGYWAGYVGAALAVLHRAGGLPLPLRPTSAEQLREALHDASRVLDDHALVIGAWGQAGTGARAALGDAGVAHTGWDRTETRPLNRSALLAHDMLVNTVLSTDPTTEPFVTPDDLDAADRRLAVICDVSCDVDSPFNVLPIYDRTTTWTEPARRLRTGPPPVDLIAIDNLPSLVPLEASIRFSADLLPLLLTLGDDAPPWRRTRQRFEEAVAARV